MADLNVQNRTLFHGDNLGFLRGIDSETIDLIATDPPFNKGRDFHATPDSLAAGAKFQDRWSWERDVHQDWVDQITDDYPRLMEAIESAKHAHSDGMGAYMCFMAVRLLEMRRVLKPSGSIYLHCDPTASHYLKAVMDAIFGWKQFRNEVIWQYRTGGISRRWFARKHDNLLFYSKSDSYVFDLPRETSRDLARFNLTDDDGRRYYVKAGNRYYADAGVAVADVWDIAPVRNVSKERMGYPTQKPLALYERIIEASSNVGDIVLDPFAGCATTLVAAERLQRQWVGMDIWDGAHQVVEQRLREATGLFGQVKLTQAVPERTDDGESAAPFLRVKERVAEPDGPRWSRAEMYDFLLTQNGSVCQGCDREFDDPLYLELDHNTPRSDGGLNHISNRLLLCGPCNRIKSNTLTLSGLRAENKKRGRIAKQ